MTFDQWWRDNEASLSRQFFQDGRWLNIYRLIQLAFEAGRTSEEDRRG